MYINLLLRYVITFAVMIKLKLTAVGNSAGVVFSKEVLARLKLDKGDAVYLTESPDGYRFDPVQPRVRIADDGRPQDHEEASRRTSRTREVAAPNLDDRARLDRPRGRARHS